MAAAVDRWPDGLAIDGIADRRSGRYRRHLLTELGDIALVVPRTRCYSPVGLAARPWFLGRVVMCLRPMGRQAERN